MCVLKNVWAKVSEVPFLVECAVRTYYFSHFQMKEIRELISVYRDFYKHMKIIVQVKI